MTNPQPDPFSVVIVAHNVTGNLIFKYYPLAGVLEVKRNRIFSQIVLQDLIDKGQAAIEQANGRPVEISLPHKVSVPVDEKL